MARVRHLRNAPITEAIVDFRVSLAKEFRPERLWEAGDLLAGEYPLIDEPKRYEAHVDLSGGQPKAAMSTRDLGFHGVRLRTEDKKTVAQFRIDGFTFNRLRPYTRWEKILPEAVRLWGVYVGLANPQGITRLALRYINHLSLPRPGVELDDYIVTAPRVPPSVPQVLSGFTTRLVLEHAERRMKANVTQALELGVETSAPSLLFDIDVYRAGDLEINSAAVTGVLGDLREYKNEIFFGSLTERFVEVFE
jgi:uncharacterized protein (TIGR04255 family)